MLLHVAVRGVEEWGASQEVGTHQIALHLVFVAKLDEGVLQGQVVAVQQVYLNFFSEQTGRQVVMRPLVVVEELALALNLVEASEVAGEGAHHRCQAFYALYPRERAQSSPELKPLASVRSL